MNVHIFDCDGVITDSNNLKTQGFDLVGRKYFNKSAHDDLMKFHFDNGGKSRWEKFNYVLKRNDLNHIDLDLLCMDYSNFVEQNLFKCNIVPGINNFINSLLKEVNIKNIYVVSAGEQNQVRRLIEFHQLPFLQENVYGSPKTKLSIFNSIKKQKSKYEFFVYGDSLHDAECAFDIKANFVFIKGFTKSSEVQIKDKYPVRNSINDFRNIFFEKQQLVYV